MKKSTENNIVAIFNKAEILRNKLYVLANYSELNNKIDSSDYCKMDGYLEKIQDWVMELK